jgi:HAD superfamily hydrolase (TIGR01549 family)
MNKALFWDFDGTLVMSRRLWTGSVHKALLSTIKDSTLTVDDVKPYLQTGCPWHSPEKDYTHLTSPSAWWDSMNDYFTGIYRALGLGESLAAAAARKVKDILLNVENFTLFDDATAVLQASVHAGYQNYILSNNFPELPEIVKKLGLSPYFSGFIVSAAVGYEKPRREIFEAALALAGHPDVCYMIGDNPIADICGAKSAGMAAILVHRDAEDCPADFRCSNLIDILPVLGI